MKNFLGSLIFLTAVSVGIVVWELSPPAQWRNINNGMTRDEVQALIGPGNSEFKELKGPFWRRDGLLIWHEMEVNFDADNRATRINRQRYVGVHTAF